MGLGQETKFARSFRQNSVLGNQLLGRTGQADSNREECDSKARFGAINLKPGAKEGRLVPFQPI